MNDDIVVLRARKGVPGVGRKIARHFGANEVTCGYRPARAVREGAYVFNYGRSTWPIWFDKSKHNMINSPDAVKKCVNKKLTLQIMKEHDVSALESTDSPLVADHWLNIEKQPVIVRHILKGKQGKGVELLEPGDSMLDAPLYTKFYNKTHEFRVHVFNGKVIDYVQKKRMGEKKRRERGIGEVNMLTRNHKQGWVFAHKDLLEDGQDTIKSIALEAARALGITYCGADVLAIYDGEKFISARLCEVNSAPGMSSPTTFRAYTKAIEEYIK